MASLKQPNDVVHEKVAGPDSARLFVVQLICCGRDDGEFGPCTYEEAERFRASYTSGPGVNEDGSYGGHDRAAIIKEVGA